MTDFVDGLGRKIPADAFENDPGPPRELPLSKEGLATFDKETAALAEAAKTGSFSAGPPNATPWDALKDLGLELVAIVILTVVAGLGSSGANFSLGFLILLWLLAILANPSKA